MTCRFLARKALDSAYANRIVVACVTTNNGDGKELEMFDINFKAVSPGVSTAIVRTGETVVATAHVHQVACTAPYISVHFHRPQLLNPVQLGEIRGMLFDGIVGLTGIEHRMAVGTAIRLAA